MPECIYCGKEKPSEEFSLEHIWPRALGGALLPDLFKTSHVCERCNNLCGLFVDGAFIKSWFVQVEAAIVGFRFLDPEKPAPIPLIYFGEESGVRVKEDEVCERWGGHGQDRIYHFHKRDGGKWHGIAGGDIIARNNADPGRAYIAFGSANEYWYTTAALSFYRQFQKSKRCVVNGTPDEDMPAEIAAALFPQKDPDDPQQADDLRSLQSALSGTAISTVVPMQLGFDHRFLCKLALGLGLNLLGNTYRRSSYATELRKGLWSRTPDQRMGLKLRGAGFFSTAQAEVPAEVKQMMSVPGSWSLCLWRQHQMLVVHVLSPSRNYISIAIEDNCKSYDQPALKPYEDGLFFFVSPYRQVSVGPIGMDELLAHKLGEKLSAKIARIEFPPTNLKDLPPRR